MSKLDELIAELCPNGVEYRRVDEICDISRGKVMSKDFIQANEGEYPVYSSQTENDGELGRISSYAYDGEYLTWTTDGANAGSVFYRKGKFSITNVCGLLKVNREDVLTRYIFHTLQVEAPKYVNKGMGNPKLMSNVMSGIKLPVPPLEVQREIVRILDSFTLLTAELTAELTARKKQYEYYRDTLLTFNDNNPLHSLISSYCPNGVEYKKIGDIAFISTGSKLRDIQESHSLYEYINAGTTNSGYSLDWNCDGDVVTTPSRGQGGIGYVGYQKNKFWLGPLCYKIVGNADFVLNKYLYYYLSNNSYEILSLKKDGGVPAINKSDLEELILPVPPLEVQRQIVQILDRFDTICSDLNIGLPAEIEARKKQYEFYRDKLLTFKQL